MFKGLYQWSAKSWPTTGTHPNVDRTTDFLRCDLRRVQRLSSAICCIYVAGSLDLVSEVEQVRDLPQTAPPDCLGISFPKSGGGVTLKVAQISTSVDGFNGVWWVH